MNKWGKLCILSLLTFSVLNGCSLTSDPELKIGMLADHTPWEYEGSDQKPEGITVDIINAFSEYTGQNVKIMWYEPDALFKALSAGTIDCAMSSLPITDEQQALYDITDPYTKTFPILLIGKNSPLISKQQLNHQTSKIAVIENSVYSQLARSEYSNANITEYQNRTEAVEAVKSGLSDCFIDDALSVVNLYKRSPEAFKVNPAPLTDKFQYFTVYIRKDQNDLKEKWNDFFTMKRNEKYFDTLYDKYVDPDKDLLLELDVFITL